MQYIPLEKTELPSEFAIDFGEDNYIMKFAYVEVGDFFTVSLYGESDSAEAEPLILGEKLVINKPLFSDFTDLFLPAPPIIPMDLSNLETSITWDNFGKTVFVYVDDDNGPFGGEDNDD